MDHSKNHPSHSQPPRDAEGFDFELTDFDDARRVLDSESLSPFDVATIVPPEQWLKARRPRVPTDRALTGRAIDWLLRLPADLRPQDLSTQFPRIANALAEASADRVQFRSVLDALLSDTRKGRQGFPAAVHRELVALRDFSASGIR